MTDSPIRLLLSDVDGTLITTDKVLTPETVRAVAQLREHDVLFSLTSARPPRGFSMFVDPLELTAPLGAFNGGLMVRPDMSPISELPVESSIVEPIIGALRSSGLSIWVYQNTDWFVLDLEGPHVAHESEVVGFGPTPIASFEDLRLDVVKIVGVSDDPAEIARGLEALREFDIAATTSQTYYLDVTNPRANKGSVVEFLARYFSIDVGSIATIGDAANDVAMFQRSGLSIAMGNALDAVKSTASHVTASHDDNGFASAVSEFILPHVSA
ncbi:MAG TPA: Cof-type HAD-IIB family hydrolase [Acidimicrobiales bacterium]|nr:Cof-type HAD-IIB family hydrolase [Acidimicrobiales bacterium]